jgi:hypothetical protein
VGVRNPPDAPPRTDKSAYPELRGHLRHQRNQPMRYRSTCTNHPISRRPRIPLRTCPTQTLERARGDVHAGSDSLTTCQPLPVLQPSGRRARCLKGMSERSICYPCSLAERGAVCQVSWSRASHFNSVTLASSPNSPMDPAKGDPVIAKAFGLGFCRASIGSGIVGLSLVLMASAMTLPSSFSALDLLRQIPSRSPTMRDDTTRRGRRAAALRMTSDCCRYSVRSREIAAMQSRPSQQL